MKKKILALFDEKLWKFLLVGVLNTLVGNGLMFLLYNLGGLSYWPATAISYALASVMSYFLNRYFTFKYTQGGWQVVLRFALNKMCIRDSTSAANIPAGPKPAMTGRFSLCACDTR